MKIENFVNENKKVRPAQIKYFLKARLNFI